MKNLTVLLYAIFLAHLVAGQANTFPSSGSAGIGTNSPVSLNLGGVSPNLQLLDRTNLFQLIGNNGTYLTNNLYYNSGWKYNANGAGMIIASSGIGDFNIQNASANSAGAGAAATLVSRIIMDAGGNFGIGTTSLVSVDLGGASPNFQISDRTNLFQLSGNNGTYLTNNLYYNGGWKYNSDGAGLIIASTGSGDFTIQNAATNSAGGGSAATMVPRFMMNSSGNVGIGTSAPSERLSVEGNIVSQGNIYANGYITTKKVIITQLGWSDYVFDDGYPLRSLTSLTSYIKANRHLPDIPSVKEVQEQGIDVGNTQAVLLKKIEELTLYVIKQQEQIDFLMREKRNKTFGRRGLAL